MHYRTYHTVHLVRFDRSEISLFLLPFSIGWVLVAAAVVIIVIIAFAIGIILPLRYADATTGPQDTFIRPGFSYLLMSVLLLCVVCGWWVVWVGHGDRCIQLEVPAYILRGRKKAPLPLCCSWFCRTIFSHAARNLGKIVLSYFYIERRREQVSMMYLSSNTKRA